MNMKRMIRRFKIFNSSEDFEKWQYNHIVDDKTDIEIIDVKYKLNTISHLAVGHKAHPYDTKGYDIDNTITLIVIYKIVKFRNINMFGDIE